MEELAKRLLDKSEVEITPEVLDALKAAGESLYRKGVRERDEKALESHDRLTEFIKSVDR